MDTVWLLCIDDLGLWELTNGKIYKQYDVDNYYYYYIMDDIGNISGYCKRRFVIIDPKQENWGIK